MTAFVVTTPPIFAPRRQHAALSTRPHRAPLSPHPRRLARDASSAGRGGAPASAAPAAALKDYMAPKYTGDAKEDLLEAIKVNDSATFVRCLDDLGPTSANTVWGGNRFNQSALLAACSRGRTPMIELLIARGADCAHRNDFGWGAVRYARKWYDTLKMVEGERVYAMLIAGGAVDEPI